MTRLVASATAIVILLALPAAAADTGVFVGYRGPVEACVYVGDSGPSFDPADCDGGTAFPMQFVGEIAVGARSGSIEVCILIDENGEVHPSCSPCEFVREVVGAADCDALLQTMLTA